MRQVYLCHPVQVPQVVHIISLRMSTLIYFGSQVPLGSLRFFMIIGNIRAMRKLLKESIIPFMLESMEFYESILYKDKNDDLHFIPSYSPEVGPKGLHPLAINATMDVAALKQLIRNLIKLESLGLLITTRFHFGRILLIDYRPMK